MTKLFLFDMIMSSGSVFLSENAAVCRVSEPPLWSRGNKKDMQLSGKAVAWQPWRNAWVFSANRGLGSWELDEASENENVHGKQVAVYV